MKMPLRLSPNKLLGGVVILGIGTMLVVAMRVAQGSTGGIAAGSHGPLRAEAVSEAAALSQQPAEAAFNDFCAAPDAMADDEDALSRCLGGGTFDLVNRWSVKRLDSLADKAPCSWAMYGDKRFSVPSAPLCLPDPASDPAVSKPIHEWAWYGGVDEHHFALGAGYAAGTPLKASHAKLLRQAAAAAAAAGSPFADVSQACRCGCGGAHVTPPHSLSTSLAGRGRRAPPRDQGLGQARVVVLPRATRRSRRRRGAR